MRLNITTHSLADAFDGLFFHFTVIAFLRETKLSHGLLSIIVYIQVNVK